MGVVGSHEGYESSDWFFVLARKKLPTSFLPCKDQNPYHTSLFRKASMTLPEIIIECEKLETPHKKSLINKLKVALGILMVTKGAEHLLARSEPPPETPPKPKVAPVARRASGKAAAVDPMPEGG